jgi:hypothetical protein
MPLMRFDPWVLDGCLARRMGSGRIQPDSRPSFRTTAIPRFARTRPGAFYHRATLLASRRIPAESPVPSPDVPKQSLTIRHRMTRLSAYSTIAYDNADEAFKYFAAAVETPRYRRCARE